MPKCVCATILILLLFLAKTADAQTKIRGIAILDLSLRNAETNNAQLFSLEHMIKVAGINYIVTQDLAAASTYSMICGTSPLLESTFMLEEKAELASYVEIGGILLAARVEDDELFALFGVSGYESDSARFEISWDTSSKTEALEWIDQPEEQTVSLGRSTYDEIFKTLGYTPTSAETLATFKDGTSAVTQNAYGKGHAISIGLSFKEVILRNQINRDYEAQRIASNGFEPTSDVFSLFVRGVFTQHHPYAVWKHTSPGNSSATLMITHDVDSETGMDTLEAFVDYEFEHDIKATYNITVRYFEDALMSAFYIDRQETMDYIIDHGHAIASHSVGHFFDFADETIFPVGNPGNTKATYLPFNDGEITKGGTIYGECEVSKNELESDIGIDIRTFRAGHLVFPKFLVDVLDELEYEYNSTFSASTVLTNFPYRNITGRSFSGDLSNIYELPITISDVFHNDPITKTNYLDKSDIWLDVTNKNIANGAPTVLLIHPNRNYKLEGMKYYLDHLPNDIHVMEMSLFGDYWRARDTFHFDSNLEEEVLTVIVPSVEALENDISFVVNDGQSLAGISVRDEQGHILNFQQNNWTDNDVILSYEDVVSQTEKETSKKASPHVYPSPTQGPLNIEFNSARAGKVHIELFDTHGRRVIKLMNQPLIEGLQKWSTDLSAYHIPQGIYLVLLRTTNGEIVSRKIVVI